MKCGYSAVWPTGIPKSSTWVSGQSGGQHRPQDPTIFANGRRPAVRSSLQMQHLPKNCNGVVIENPDTDIQWVVTNRNKHPNPGPTLSFYNIQYSVKRRKLIGNPEPYPILKGIRYVRRRSTSSAVLIWLAG